MIYENNILVQLLNIFCENLFKNDHCIMNLVLLIRNPYYLRLSRYTGEKLIVEEITGKFRLVSTKAKPPHIEISRKISCVT